ncbi:tRNA 2-thiocytidine(32) synthetase TtcA [Herbaspirillum sp. meg3]|jgi:tRNA 2-thiocytidine biosynthesis protein TtcA|uniref:tRNA 2-thiocytidine(32) synthetase TtcA n=1 Tax=Herbaspirillum sp. meg3 TaxID=2025949 RepID=UPI000B99A1B1|nr:tRNA 2-thiocytidine(32) synthetase TtcA [Herbaspirillum sp. meg3]ASU37186.1 tRNA 2-thiocytidine(32) synthetase TtcA [Herbaspirillum sp. meg3]
MNDLLEHAKLTEDTSAAPDAPQAVALTSVKQAEKIAYENNKLHKRLCRLTGQAIGDYNMIEDGDKVMVCLSGGKDSYALLDILLTLRERAPIHFDIIAVNLDQKQPNFPADVLPAYLEKLGVAYHIENQDTYSIVKRVVPEGKTTCALCSRLRRGILYRVATELGATKIALGHHRDDILETFFLNMFFGGKLKGMPPKLQSDDGKQIVIRPLAYVKEADLTRYAEVKEFPIIPCDLCGSQENLQRKQIKGLMREWEKKYPGRVDNIFASLSTVAPSHLMDRNLFDFANLKATGVADADGDIAFDEDPCATSNPTAQNVISLHPAD